MIDTVGLKVGIVELVLALDQLIHGRLQVVARVHALGRGRHHGDVLDVEQKVRNGAPDGHAPHGLVRQEHATCSGLAPLRHMIGVVS